MKKINGLVAPDILTKFPSGFPLENGYIGYVSNCIGLEGILAAAAFFAPEFIEHQGAILLSSNIEDNIENISTRFGTSKKQIEQYNNLLCLSEFFLLPETTSPQDDVLTTKFGEVLIYYWKNRLKQVYPKKSFEFLLEKDLFDEDGICISFFEH